MFAAVSHDFGKAVSTVIENGRIISHGHEETGLPLAESFLSSIDAPNEIREVVVPPVRYHMVRNPKT